MTLLRDIDRGQFRKDPTLPDNPRICVIIAARNACKTVAASVRSALRDAYVAEVIVVDDASNDGTGAEAKTADDGTNRLRLITFADNRGPSAARNEAIARSTSPYIAILDADDFFVAGRFAALFAIPDWDMIADNIAFVREDRLEAIDMAALLDGNGAAYAAHRELRLAEFVRRNIAVRGQSRAELGFLKPLIRRSFLEKHRLLYDENVRLGEDFILYAHAMATGARFLLSARCGYVAIERPSSLSGSHSLSDLANLLAADKGLVALPNLETAEKKALNDHLSALKIKVAHRRFLEEKRQSGIGAAFTTVASDLATLAGVSRGILADKLDLFRTPTAMPDVRLLFTESEFARPAGQQAQ